MKTFETPIIEVITFTAESIMNDSLTGPQPTYSGGDNKLPWDKG